MLLPPVLPAGDVPALMRSLDPGAEKNAISAPSTSQAPDRPWIVRLLIALSRGLPTARSQPLTLSHLKGEER
jgi:hypothetical protein